MHFAGELALRGVILHEVGEVVGRNEVVDGHDVEFLAQQTLFDEGPEDQTTDPTEPVDPDFDGCH